MIINNSSNDELNVELEGILSSRGRVRILKLLAKEGELNISAISKKTKLNHSSVKSHLEFLVEVGLIKEKKFGRIKIYQYLDTNIKAHSLKQLFCIWEEI